MAAPRLTFSVGPQTGSVGVQAVTEFSQAQLTMNLRTGPQLTFGMPGRSPAALQTDGLVTDVWVYKNGTLFRRLRVLPVDQSWDEDGNDDASVTAVGYQRLVESRFIVSGPPTFTATDQGEILWQLVQHTQGQSGGSLGITAGSRTTGQVRDRNEYKIGDQIGNLMSDIGDVSNGAWWGIDAAKVFTAQLFSAFTVRTDPIVLGANARKLTRQRGKTFANAAGAVGSAQTTVPVWHTTAGIATDPRGRWEAWDASHSSVTDQASVPGYADGLLNERAHPPSVWSITLDPAAYFEGSSNYSEGQYVSIVIPVTAVDEIGSPPLSVQAQITEVVIAFDESGALTVTMAAMETA